MPCGEKVVSLQHQTNKNIIMIKHTKTFILLAFSAFMLFACNKDYDYEIGVTEQIEITLESSGPSTGCCWLWNKKDNILNDDTACPQLFPKKSKINSSEQKKKITVTGNEI